MSDFNRIKLSKEATFRARSTAGRLRITPNILYRFGICLSLEDPSIPNPAQYGQDGQEIDRHTLLGEWDSFFIALVRQRLTQDGLNLERDFDSQFKAHLNRGALLFCNRVRDLADIHDLLPERNAAASTVREGTLNRQND
jgi:DNA sulfur modification protein DndE